MKVRILNTDNRKDVKDFIDFPFQLYKNCTQWIPNLEREMKLVLNRSKHPFYKHSNADFLVVESEHQILGRIAVLKNENYCNHHNGQYGFFYYFETIEDAQASTVLLSAAIDWHLSHGVQQILGPKGFLRSNGVGQLVEGFRYIPSVSMIYNYPYYDTYLEQSGFEKETDHFSGFIDRSVVINPRLYEIVEKIKERSNFWIKKFKTRNELREWVPRVEKVHHEAFHNNPGYYPSTPEEFNLIAENMISIADPSLMRLIMKNEVVAGFMIAYPDISKAIQKCEGKIYPFGWFHLLREMQRTKVLDMNGIGILPLFQGLGSNALLYVELEKTLRASRFEQLNILQVDERNYRSKADMEAVGTKWIQKHRTYHLNLTR
jgi:hypothetical protein